MHCFSKFDGKQSHDGNIMTLTPKEGDLVIFDVPSDQNVLDEHKWIVTRIAVDYVFSRECPTISVFSQTNVPVYVCTPDDDDVDLDKQIKFYREV